MQQQFRLISAAPRSHLFTRSLSTSTRRLADKSFKPAPSAFGGFSGAAPPRLPKEEQEIFEELQKQSTGAFSTPKSPPQINQSADSSTSEQAQVEEVVLDRTAKLNNSDAGEFKKAIEARGKGEELHPNVRRGAPPEFEGDVNPKTGEVGGPKNEPLRWGAAGEWAYNGRTTDF